MPNEEQFIRVLLLYKSLSIELGDLTWKISYAMAKSYAKRLILRQANQQLLDKMMFYSITNQFDTIIQLRFS
jgi:hypothetical protein